MPRGFPDWSMGAYLIGRIDPLLNFLQWAARNRADRTTWIAHTCYTEVAPCRKTMMSVPEGHAGYVSTITLQITDGEGTVDFYLQPSGMKVWTYRASAYVERVKEFRIPLSLGESEYLEAEMWPNAAVGYMTVNIFTRYFLEELTP